MTEEEFFVSNYPDSCYGDKPLSPHWDFFQDGVQFGERQSEEKIKVLEESLEKLQKSTFDMIDEKNNRIADLEETINKLREQLALRYDLEDKIAELKKNNEILTKVINNVHVVRIRQLTKENTELEAQIEEMKQERSAEVRQRAINEIVSAIEKDREEGR